jgi:hypothetical protein
VTDDMIEIALAITAGSFLIALAYLSWATWLTSRRERLASQKSPQDHA